MDTACGLGLAGVAIYAAEPGSLWVQVWIPAIAGALLVGALTVLVLDIIVGTAVDEARQRQLKPLRDAAEQEKRTIRAKVDQFLEKWQYVIGELRGDYLEVVREEEGAGSFPEPLVSRLPLDTLRLLYSGWGQPNHDKVLARPAWQEAVEIASQVKRQSDRIVEWYSEVLDPPVSVAFGRIQEYLLAAVENMPRTGRTEWFRDEGTHQDFLAAYRAVWLEDDPALEAARQRTRDIWIAIWEGVGEGRSERHMQERDRSYEDPALVSLYEAVNPWGQREDYYLELVTSARALLDLGCGTGRLLKRAARTGGSRVLAGVDRAPSMLAAAAPADEAMSWEESQIIWRLDDMRTADLGRRFDLITMTGYAFQELLTDGDIRMVLSNVLRHLDPGGRFAFDVHRRDNEPLARVTPGASVIQVTTSSGDRVDVVRTLERTVEPDLVEFITTYAFRDPPAPVVSRSMLRFIELDHLRAMLEDAGFRIDRWFGDRDSIPFTPSPAKDVVVATYLR